MINRVKSFFKSRKTPTTIFPVSKAFETFSTIVIIALSYNFFFSYNITHDGIGYI